MNHEKKSGANRLTTQVLVLAGLVFFPIGTVVYRSVEATAVLLDSSDASSELASTEDKNSKPAMQVNRVPKDWTDRFGVYDPGPEFAADSNLRIRHIYISWVEFDPVVLKQQIHDSVAQGFHVFLTIEPWPTDSDAKELLLPDVLHGKYDPIFAVLHDILSSVQSTLYVSWGHEMDQDLVERYPWSGQDPQVFCQAFRYAMDHLGVSANDNLKSVWTGVLKTGSMKYWPGHEWIDYIGLPVYSFPEWEQRHIGYIRSFSEIFEEKYRIVQDLGKPIIISELGVCGSDEFKNYWLRQMFLEFDNYSCLEAVIFFYSRDVDGAWGTDIRTPDWRVHPDAIRSLVSWKIGEHE